MKNQQISVGLSIVLCLLLKVNSEMTTFVHEWASPMNDRGDIGQEDYLLGKNCYHNYALACGKPKENGTSCSFVLHTFHVNGTKESNEGCKFNISTNYKPAPERGYVDFIKVSKASETKFIFFYMQSNTSIHQTSESRLFTGYNMVGLLDPARCEFNEFPISVYQEYLPFPYNAVTYYDKKNNTLDIFQRQLKVMYRLTYDVATGKLIAGPISYLANYFGSDVISVESQTDFRNNYFKLAQTVDVNNGSSAKYRLSIDKLKSNGEADNLDTINQLDSMIVLKDSSEGLLGFCWRNGVIDDIYCYQFDSEGNRLVNVNFPTDIIKFNFNLKNLPGGGLLLLSEEAVKKQISYFFRIIQTNGQVSNPLVLESFDNVGRSIWTLDDGRLCVVRFLNYKNVLTMSGICATKEDFSYTENDTEERLL